MPSNVTDPMLGMMLECLHFPELLALTACLDSERIGELERGRQALFSFPHLSERNCSVTFLFSDRRRLSRTSDLMHDAMGKFIFGYIIQVTACSHRQRRGGGVA